MIPEFLRGKPVGRSGIEEEEGGRAKLYVYGVFLVCFVILLFIITTNGQAQPFGQCLALVKVEGEISSAGEKPTLFSPGVPSAYDYAELIRKLDEDPSVVGILLYINSPGGSVVASRELWEAVRSANKTVVAYLSDVATSGGYYVASASDYIIANPNTITGSIGVIAVFPDLTGLSEKIGVNMTVLKVGKFKDSGNPFRKMTKEEREWIEAMLQEAYSDFINAIKEGRKGKLRENFMMYADGRIFSGRFAKSLGLVDALGSLKDAERRAWELAGKEGEPNICERSPFFYSSGLTFSIFPIFKEIVRSPGLYYLWGIG